MKLGVVVINEGYFKLSIFFCLMKVPSIKVMVRMELDKRFNLLQIWMTEDKNDFF